MNPIRILIVDDHAILRDGIRSLLETQPDLRVVGEAANGTQGLERVAELQPDIVLMDIAMPEMNGLEATRQIKVRFPQVQVLILTQHDEAEYVAPLLEAGAAGYVLKRSGGREVINAIRQVIEHGGYLEPDLARQALAGRPAKTPEQFQEPQITPREQQVLALLARGKSNKEIAHQLNISPKTVSVHRSNLMVKLGLNNNLELLRYADQHGLAD